MIRRRDTTSSPANLHPRKYSPRRQPAEGEPTRSHDGVNGSRILATGGSWKLTTLPSSGSSVAAMGMRPRSLWCCRLEGDDPSSTCRASRPPPGPWSGWSRAGRRPPRPRHHTVALGNVEVRDGTAHRLPVGDASVDLMDRQGAPPGRRGAGAAVYSRRTTRRPAGHPLAVRAPRGPGGGRPDRVPAGSPSRSSRRTPASRSTTRSTCGAGDSDQNPPTLTRGSCMPSGSPVQSNVPAPCRAACTWAGVAAGCVDLYSAAAPATCGLAIDVPEIER